MLYTTFFTIINIRKFSINEVKHFNSFINKIKVNFICNKIEKTIVSFGKKKLKTYYCFFVK